MASSTRSGKGQRRNQPTPSFKMFYLGLGLIAVLGIGFVLFQALSKPASVSNTGPMPNQAGLNAPVGKTDDNYWYKGKPDAPVKVEIYADYECPACRSLEVELAQANFDGLYVETGKAQVIFREFPLKTIHKSAQLTAEIARCAGDQNLFWPIHNALFDSQTQWAKSLGPKTQIMAAVEQAGADRQQIESCIEAGTYTDVINDAYDAAIERQLQQTPTVFVDGQQVNFETDFAKTLMAAVDAKLPASSNN
ncbi:DsbA family protein [Herpetosiphon giganteus]|uniref:DsbA family protein n=1 Tax=Herpetosiphon giganteus TaxID=2029754 RepID=UPI00195A0E3A|nr:thioredoxin domain-containing protein [Herpetosiphon giganteus]MBM7844411.1 protein-disulfide isomerase [Herpetosiphon giganteus]